MDQAARHRGQLDDELLLSVVDAAPDGMVVVDDTGMIEFTNPMAAELFGYAVDELLGEPVEILLPESLRPGTSPAGRATPPTLALGQWDRGSTCTAVAATGEEFPVEIGLSPVQRGTRTYVIAVVRDVTDRRAAAQELMRAHEELALVDDRERIARDLHDTVIQRLFAVGLALQGSLVGGSASRTAERVETAIDEIDGTIRDIRTSIFSLHARRVSTTGVRDDVLATTREAGRALGFEPSVEFEGPVDAATPTAVREQLVPTLREALSNVVKHAVATQVTVTVVIGADDIILRVVDDGVGVPEGPHGGRGLGNMIERAVALGGRSELRAGDPAGTVLEWRVPLQSSS